MTAPSHIILAADAADYPRLAQIEAAGDAQFPPGRFPGEPGSDNVPMEELDAGRADGLQWIAVAQDGHRRTDTAIRADGFALCVRRGSHLHLRQLVVEPSLQRCGIGTSFIERALTEATNRGCSAVTLTTSSDIPRNGPYYQKKVFRPMESNELSMEVREDLGAERDAGAHRHDPAHLFVLDQITKAIAEPEWPRRRSTRATRAWMRSTRRCSWRRPSRGAGRNTGWFDPASQAYTPSSAMPWMCGSSAGPDRGSRLLPPTATPPPRHHGRPTRLGATTAPDTSPAVRRCHGTAGYSDSAMRKPPTSFR